MTKQREFAVNLAKNNMKAPQIKEMVDVAFPNDGLSLSQIYRILKGVMDGEDMEDKRKHNPKKSKRTEEFINIVKEVVEAERRISIDQLASKFEVSKSTIHAVLHDNLKLSKKAVRWVPKFLSKEQKTARVFSS